MKSQNGEHRDGDYGSDIVPLSASEFFKAAFELVRLLFDELLQARFLHRRVCLMMKIINHLGAAFIVADRADDVV